MDSISFTDFNGIKRNDMGLRPDGSVRTCPVQLHNCISFSTPLDTDHYAPPLRWSRSKSPEQAYDEIKNVYTSYPKRGLKWTNGWIDRGGWKPQIFGGPYFYVHAESLLWHYDIELVLDVDTREAQFARPHVWDQDDQATQTSNKAKQSNDKNIVSLAATSAVILASKMHESRPLCTVRLDWNRLD